MMIKMTDQPKHQWLNIFLVVSLNILFVFGLLTLGFYWGQKKALLEKQLVKQELGREEKLVADLEKINWQPQASPTSLPEVLEQEAALVEQEAAASLGGNEAEWQVQPDWQVDWIDPDPEDPARANEIEAAVPEWEQMADDIDQDGIPDEKDPIVIQPEAGVIVEEPIKDTGLLTAKSLDCGFELLYPAFVGGKDTRYKVYFFDRGQCEFTLISWKNREIHDVFFSFIFRVDNLAGENVADLAAQEALAWQRMFGERIFPRPLTIGGREAWLLAYNNMYTVFLHQKGDPMLGAYIQITAYDEVSLQLARAVFETMRSF